MHNFSVLPAGCSCALVGAGPASSSVLLFSSSPFPSGAPSLSQSVISPGLWWPVDCGLVSANSWICWRTLQEAAMNLYTLAQRSPMGSLCWYCERGRANLSAWKLGCCGGGMKFQKTSSSFVCAAWCWQKRRLCLALIWALGASQTPPWGSSSCSVFSCSAFGSFCCYVS